MIKVENVVTPSPEQWHSTIFGARNAFNSWNRSDSGYSYVSDVHAIIDGELVHQNPVERAFCIGKNDWDLMTRLRNSGTDHRKFMRMITVYMDITAPLYWWKEFSTYKVGTVTNSCSTMHKIHSKEFTLEDFSCEHLDIYRGHVMYAPTEYHFSSMDLLKLEIDVLNQCRENYLKTKAKSDWWQMIQLLPSSYNQKRTVMLNYEVLANMYKSRKNHKLDEWRTFCEWMKTLPYSELITGDFKEATNDIQHDITNAVSAVGNVYSVSPDDIKSALNATFGCPKNQESEN